MKRLWKKLKKLKTASKIINTAILSLLLIFIIQTSCDKKIKETTELESKIAQSTLQKVRDKWRGITTLEGFFRITAKIRGNLGSIKSLIVISLPDRLRLELITPGGTTEAILTLDGDVVKLFYPVDNIFFFGKASRENINKILGIDLLPEEILPILIGKGHDISLSPQSIITEKGFVILKYTSSSGLYLMELKIDREHSSIHSLRAVVKDTEKLFAEVNYEKFIHREAYSYPTRAKLNFPDKSTTYKIKILNAAYSIKPADEKSFKLEPRNDSKIYLLEKIKVKGTLLFGEEE
jgi:outer membrane lipoprotein-sorting protein